MISVNIDSLVALIRDGLRLAWKVGSLAIEAAKSAVTSYLLEVKKWTIRIAIAAVAPLIVVVPCLVFRAPLGGLYGAYVVWLVLLLIVELLLLTPVFLIWRRLRAIFPAIAQDIGDWAGFIKSVIFNGLSLALFVTLFPLWRSPGALPLLLIVLACWLTLPACGFSSVCRKIYPTIRGIQLLLLVGLVVLQVAFPRQMEQIGWASSRRIGNTLEKSVGQKEVSVDWEKLTWFSNVGENLVWYSGSDSSGYRLWSAPGFDPDSGAELTPVANAETRSKILSHFTAKRDLEEKFKLANQAAAAKAAIEQETARTANMLVRYLGKADSQKSGVRPRLAVLAVSQTGQIDLALTKAIADAFPTNAFLVTTTRFTPAFVSDGLFRKAYEDAGALVGQLALTNILEAFVLARHAVQYSTNSSTRGLVTATASLEVLPVSVENLKALGVINVSASGVGFKAGDALSQADERLFYQLTNSSSSLKKINFNN